MSLIIDPYKFAAPGGGDVFADPFNDSSLDTGKWARRHNDADITLVETTYLEWQTAGGNVALNDALDSIATIDFTGRTLDFHLPLVGSLGFFFVVGIIDDPITDDNVNRAHLVTSVGGGGTETVGQTRIGGSNTTTSNVLWSAGSGGQINYWRMRHDSGTDILHYEYNLTGAGGFGGTFTSLGTFSSFDANFGDLTQVHPFIWLVGGGDTNPHVMRIKDFRIY